MKTILLSLALCCLTAADAQTRQTIAPMVSAEWGQGNPYNLYITGSTSKYQTGCGATAAAAVMRYWKYPEKGIDHQYDAVKLSDGTTIQAINTNITFDWDGMKSTYAAFDGLSTEGVKAVAELMYAVGRSADMQYSKASSGSTTPALAYGLINDFGYDKAAEVVVRDASYTDTEWEDLVYGELAAGRPVLYSATPAEDARHIFVIDGYNEEEGGFHVRWGWSGASDGYYPISGENALNSNPNMPAKNCTYNKGHYFVKGLKPDEGGKLKYCIQGQKQYYLQTNQGSYTQGYLCYLMNCDLANSTLGPAEIYLGTRFKDTTTGETFYYEKKSAEKDFTINTTITYMYFYVPKTLRDGCTYSVRPAYKDENGEWKDVPFVCNITEPTITIPGTPSGIDAIKESTSSTPVPAIKVIEDNRIKIVKGKKTYNISGQIIP